MDQRNIFANPAPLYNAITNGGSLNKVDGFSDDGVSVNSGSPIGNDSYKSLKLRINNRSFYISIYGTESSDFFSVIRG